MANILIAASISLALALVILDIMWLMCGTPDACEDVGITTVLANLLLLIGIFFMGILRALQSETREEMTPLIAPKNQAC